MSVLPFTDGEAWTRVSISNGRGAYVALPGFTIIEQIDRSQKMDVRSSPLFEGATYINQGFEPSPVVMTVHMWLDEHIKKWEDEILPIITPSFKPNRVPASISIVNPMLQMYGIDKVVFRSVSGLVWSGPSQECTSKITTTEYRPQKPVKPGVIKPTPKVDQGNNVDPTTHKITTTEGNSSPGATPPPPPKT